MKKLSLLLIFLLSFALSAISQTATGVVTQVPCNNNGIYTVTTTGIPLPITYTYYVNGTSVIHSNINSATDQLVNFGMDNSGFIYCQASGGGLNAWAQNTYTPSFTFYTSGISPVCPATMGTVTATQISGTPGPFTYNWTNTQTLLSYSGNNATVPIGEYEVVITDQTTGCVLQISDSAIYIQQLSNVTGTVNVTPASCTNGTATVVASGGMAPYTYLWATGATSSTITGLSQGYYPVTITDAQGCQSNFVGAFIQQNPRITVNTTVTNATCLQTDGSAIAFGSGGVGPYTYAWSNGQTGNTATNLSGSTSYTVIATDANGCSGQRSAWIQTNTPINVTYTSTASQCTSATGSVSLAVTGGTAPYTYLWINNSTATGATLTNVAPGTYAFQVTDAVGCIRTGTAVVSPISTINASVQASTVVCPNTTGTATAVVNGSNPPFTYLWSNGATTSQITGVGLGSYSCVITDGVGCSVTKSASVRAVSPIRIAVSATPATCLYNTDGSATASATGGLAPYTYSYTNGSTTANATGLGVGRYWVTVTDANGCSSRRHFWITNAATSTSCYCTISGTVYVDANTNCNLDAGEAGLQNIMIHCSGFGYTFTDANGNYSFQVPTGTYTISQQVHAYYPLAACQSNSNSVSVVAAAGCNTVMDMANDVTVIHDLKVLTLNSTLPPIPGNNYRQKVIVKNEGTVVENGLQMGYEHDSQMPFANSTLPSFMQVNSMGAPYNYSVQTGFPTLNPNATNVMLLNYNTPTNIPLGTSVSFYDTVANMASIGVNWLLDYSPWNNVNTYQTTVIGSYDPNYKEVYPKGEGPQGTITSDVTELDYTIHFQNEGTYFAQNISVTDQLDSDLDWTTFRPGYSDYAYTTTISEGGLVTFTFANINLPWKSAYGDELSSGLVNYSIQRKSTNPQGTEFTNTADIYFDYNPPITTNTTLNTLNDPANSVIDDLSDAITVDVYPVPAKDLISIRVNHVSKNAAATLTILDMVGSVIMSGNIDLNEGSTTVTQNLSGLAQGTYVARIQFENGSYIAKKVVLY